MAKNFGICALTGEYGKFVDCHIIPRSLTFCGNSHRKGITEAPFAEISTFSRPKRAQTSWSDKQLVVQRGEDWLAKIDDQGLQLLRRHSLVEGRKSNLVMAARNLSFADGEVQILRRFLLSIFWRAAVSSRPEFAEVIIDKPASEKLKQFILGLVELDVSDFPIQVRELVGDLPEFNTSPYVESREIVNLRTGGTLTSEETIFKISRLIVTFGKILSDLPRYKALKEHGLGYAGSWNVDQIQSDEIVGSLTQKIKNLRPDWNTEFSRLVS